MQPQRVFEARILDHLLRLPAVAHLTRSVCTYIRALFVLKVLITNIDSIMRFYIYTVANVASYFCDVKYTVLYTVNYIV